jgi:hypothetical protein
MSKPKPGYTVRWFFGGVLMAVGFLMAALSGLCSAGVGGKSDNNEFLFALMLVALVGGPPIVLGGLLYVVGRFLRGSGL